MGFSFFVLGYITKLMVMICPSVKISDLFIFFITGVSIMSEPCRRRVGEGKKKHRSDTEV